MVQSTILSVEKKRDEKEDKHAEILLVCVSVQTKATDYSFKLCSRCCRALLACCFSDVAFISFFFLLRVDFCLHNSCFDWTAREREGRDDKNKMRGY